MDFENEQKARSILKDVYGQKASRIFAKIETLLDGYKDIKNSERKWVDQNDVMVITYADSIVSKDSCGIRNLDDVFEKHIGNSVSAVHLLPFFNYSSDDGFSVINYRQPTAEAGTWDDIGKLSKKYDLMFDAVINHVSSQSEWFKGYVAGQDKFKNFFIECDPTDDYSMVTRPRALPLLTKVETAMGTKHVWTTFSEDQIDLNYKDEDLLVEVLDILLFYVKHGARYIRLDAIGFLWKELKTCCMHHKNTHQIIRLMRWVIEQIDKDVILITETNTPQEENISYFGEFKDEAHMVYQFPLPPLLVHMFLTEDSTTLLNWYDEQVTVDEHFSFFNFVASHDGIGVRPLEGILSADEVNQIADTVKKRGGRVSYRNMPDGSQKPYELNISLLSLISGDCSDIDKKVSKFMASQAVLLSVVGVPGIYIHSLLGSENDIEGMESSGINRRINRQKLDKHELIEALNNPESIRCKVLNAFKNMLDVRKQCTAFSPAAMQTSDSIDKRIFAITRHNKKTGDQVIVRINISNESVQITDSGTDILTDRKINGAYNLKPYEVLWLT